MIRSPISISAAAAHRGSRLGSLGALLLLLAGLFTNAGCPAIQWYMRQSGKGAVSGFYEGMSHVDPAVHRRITSTVLEDPNLQKFAHDLTSSIVLGASDGMTQAKLDALAGRVVQSAMTTLREQGSDALNQLMKQAGPALEQSLRRGVEESVLAMGAAMHKTAETDMGAATTLLMRAAVDGVLQSLRHSSRELGRELNDSTEQYLKEKVAPGAGHIARTLTREAMLGLHDGLTETGVKEQLPALRLVMHEIGAGLGEGMGEGLGRSVHKSPLEPILTGITIILAVLFIGAVIGLVLMWRRYVSVTRSLSLFAQELSQAEKTDQEHTQYLVRAIRDAHTAANHTAFLDKFLKYRGLYRPLPTADVNRYVEHASVVGTTPPPYTSDGPAPGSVDMTGEHPGVHSPSNGESRKEQRWQPNHSGRK